MMRRTLAVLFPVVAMLLFVGGAWADAAGPGSCFGSSDNSPPSKKLDAGGDAKLVQGQTPTRSDTRRAGVGLLSAALVTSGWLVLRRQDLKR
jgi:hypothetical protein